jgi:hypothetical protein
VTRYGPREITIGDGCGGAAGLIQPGDVVPVAREAVAA